MKKFFIGLLVVVVALFIVFNYANSQSTAIIELVPYADGSGGEWFWLATPTERVITTTPLPTQTAWVVTATAIDTATATPVIEPTATQEDFRTPSATPLPVVTATPSKTATPTTVGCWGTVVADTLNVRDKPYGIRLGSVAKGDQLAFDQQWRDVNGDLWWRIYLAFDDKNQVVIHGWVASWWINVPSNVNCGHLPDVTPKESTVLLGGHTIAANGANTLLSHCQQVETVMLFQDMIGYADDFHACNPDMWVVCRYWTDGIAHDTNYDANASFERVGNAFPSDCNAVIWENESAPTTTRQWEQWSPYSIRAAELSAQRGMQYCAFGWGPGWPAFDKLVYMVDYMRWVNDHPLPDGRYHCIASHASMYAPWGRGDMPWVNEDYIAGRVWLMRDWIYVTTPDNFDLDTWKGQWAITEIGLSDGYSGNWSAPYSCQELAGAAKTTKALYEQHGYPMAIEIWNFGAAGNWTDDSRCASTIWPYTYSFSHQAYLNALRHNPLAVG